jgi:hypothetical protein
MILNDDDLRAIWREGSRPVQSDRSACLTEAAWAHLLSKDADNEARARAAVHIGSCTACADEYRLLMPLQGWADDLDQAFSRSDAGRSRRSVAGWLAWLSVPRPALALVAAAVLVVMLAVPLYLVIDSRRHSALLEKQLAQNRELLSSTQASMAALQDELRLRAAAQATELNGLKERAAQLSNPQLGVIIRDLDATNAGVVRGAAKPEIVTTGRDVSLITLILHFEALKSRSILEVEIADESGQPRGVARSERDRATASLTLALPALGYPAGRYEIRLFDVTRGRTAIATYSVVIRAPDVKEQ